MLPAVSFEGRVVADPELRFSPSGVAVCKIRTVSSSRKRQDDGSWVDDKTCWLDVTCFKQTAEHVAESLQKGDLVTVTGRVQTDEWTSPDGEKRSKIVCVADSVAASLTFRSVPHGAGRVERSSEAATADPWVAVSADSDPPF